MLIFFTLWYIIGIILFHTGEWILKQGLFDKDEDYTIGRFCATLLYSLIGPFLIFPLATVIYEEYKFDDALQKIKDFPLIKRQK